MKSMNSGSHVSPVRGGHHPCVLSHEKEALFLGKSVSNVQNSKILTTIQEPITTKNCIAQLNSGMQSNPLNFGITMIQTTSPIVPHKWLHWPKAPNWE